MTEKKNRSMIQRRLIPTYIFLTLVSIISVLECLPAVGTVNLCGLVYGIFNILQSCQIEYHVVSCPSPDMVPQVATMIPLFQMFSSAKLLNTMAGFFLLAVNITMFRDFPSVMITFGHRYAFHAFMNVITAAAA